MCRVDGFTTFMCQLFGILGASTSRNPKGLSRPVQVLFACSIGSKTNLQSDREMDNTRRPIRIQGLYVGSADTECLLISHIISAVYQSGSCRKVLGVLKQNFVSDVYHIPPWYFTYANFFYICPTNKTLRSY